jgi:hypothetical protein
MSLDHGVVGFVGWQDPYSHIYAYMEYVLSTT